MALDPVFIQTENGLDNIDVPAFPLCDSFQMVLDQLGELATVDHNYKTVVVDSVDWLETLVWKQVAAENGGKSIESIPYGKGYVMALDLWGQYLTALNWLRDNKGMSVIQIGHSEIKKYENPETDGYDRFQLKLHKLASPKIMEQSDVILFVNHFISTRKSKDDKMKAIGSGEVVLYTQERPAFVAGNRYNLPPEMPFDREGSYWTELVKAIPFYRDLMAQKETTKTTKQKPTTTPTTEEEDD